MQWNGDNGTLTTSIFTSNYGKWDAGGVYWGHGCDNGTLTDCSFIGNRGGNIGGGVIWNGPNGVLSGSTFINNTAGNHGAGVRWFGINARLTNCIFINNNCTYRGGAICWDGSGSVVNCSFVNSKSDKSNGIYVAKDLNINGGKGIVYIVTQGTLSGISIVVLNNETYYYPPNTNINFTKKNIKQDMIE